MDFQQLDIADAIVNALSFEFAVLHQLQRGEIGNRQKAVELAAEETARAEQAQREAKALEVARHNYNYLRRFDILLPENDESNPQFIKFLAEARKDAGLPEVRQA